MSEFDVRDIRYVDVEGTDAILQLVRKPKKGIVQISTLSKKYMTEHTNLHALGNGILLSSMLALWTVFFTSLALPLVAALMIAGIPVFAILSKGLNNFLITKKDFTLGGREQDKDIYADALNMPTFEFDESVFNKSVTNIIDSYSEAYIKSQGGNSTNNYKKLDNQLNNSDFGSLLGQDRTFSKVFYEDATEDITETSIDDTYKNKSDNEEVQEVVQNLIMSEDEQLSKFVEESSEVKVEDRITINDNRAGPRDTYYG